MEVAGELGGEIKELKIKTRQDIEELTVGADCVQTIVMFGGDAATAPVISTTQTIVF